MEQALMYVSGMEDGIEEEYFTKVMLWRRELERELRIIMSSSWLIQTFLLQED